jgi:ribosome-binding protein aMBF1 (putative translation factor)
MTVGFKLIEVQPVKKPNESVKYPSSTNGKQLSSWRISAGMSMADLSTRTGLTITQIHALERGAITLAEDDWRRLFAKIGS